MHFLQHDAHGHDAHDAHDDEHVDDAHELDTPDEDVHQVHAAKTHPELRRAPDPTDPQDMRNMGGLRKLMPKTRLTYLIACISIAGFPIAAGFYSKDEILWKAMSNGTTLIPGWLIWAIGFLAAGCTSFYMFRSYYMTFFGREATDEMKHHVHESPASMTGVLWVLAVLAVVTAFIGLPHLLFGTSLFEGWLAPVMASGPFRQVQGAMGSHTLEVVLIVMSIGIATAGWLLARFFYRDMAVTEARMARIKARYDGAHELLYNKYWVDEIYQRVFIRPFERIASGLAWFDAHIVDWVVNAMGVASRGAAWVGGWIDRTFVDGAVNGVAAGIMRIGREGRRLQTGRVNNYVYGIAIGVLALAIITRFAL